MRLFVALDIDRDIRDKIAAFRDQLRPLAPDVKWVNPETFHVTLQFLGETKKLDEIRRSLEQVRSSRIDLAFRKAGFFPNPKSARVFWVGIEADSNLPTLVSAIGHQLETLGFKRDSAPYTPHLTLARAGSGRPRPVKGEGSAPGLQQVRARIDGMTPVDFGTMTASQFYLYESKLSPAGPKYSKLARYALG
jgi:2'-5' RNA ligase